MPYHKVDAILLRLSNGATSSSSVQVMALSLHKLWIQCLYYWEGEQRDCDVILAPTTQNEKDKYGRPRGVLSRRPVRSFVRQRYQIYNILFNAFIAAFSIHILGLIKNGKQLCDDVVRAQEWDDIT